MPSEVRSVPPVQELHPKIWREHSGVHFGYAPICADDSLPTLLAVNLASHPYLLKRLG